MIRKIMTGYQVKYPNHRDSNGKIVYRLKKVSTREKAKRLERKLFSEFEDRELFGVPHEVQSRKDWSVSRLLDWFIDLDHTTAEDRTKPLKEYFGSTNIHHLTKTEVKAYRSWRAKQNAMRNTSVCEHTIKPATINREVGLLKQAYNEAGITPNPCKGVRAFKEQARDRVLSDEEFAALKKELSGEPLEIVTIGYYTGMRKSEIMNMEADRVSDGMFYLRAEDTKTKEPRKVPFMHEEVESIFLRRPPQIYGRIFKVRCIRTVLENACKRAGIEDFTFHDLRHTAATNMSKAGIDTPVVMSICGWKSVAMFLRYNNVGKKDLENAGEILASATQ